MEHLVLALVLLAGSLAASNPLQDLGTIKKMRLTMARSSFDDQYRGCGPKMDKELQKLHQKELSRNNVYAQNWPQAFAEWQKRASYVQRPPWMRSEHAVALLAYTRGGNLYPTFNAAVREAGRSRKRYLYKFDFKALHYLLTQALKILRKAHPKCYQVYRGVRNIHFTARPHAHVRFGQFASSSLLKEKAASFGQDTFFSVYTCYGVSIKNFSMYPNEEEVLIPPYETFVVSHVTHHGNRTHIHLRAKGTYSKYNCEWLKGKRFGDKPCDFSADRTIVVDLPAPQGVPPGRHGTGSHGGSPSLNATTPQPEREVPNGGHQHHRDDGMAGDSIWGWGHGDSPAAAPVPT